MKTQEFVEVYNFWLNFNRLSNSLISYKRFFRFFQEKWFFPQSLRKSWRKTISFRNFRKRGIFGKKAHWEKTLNFCPCSGFWTTETPDTCNIQDTNDSSQTCKLCTSWAISDKKTPSTELKIFLSKKISTESNNWSFSAFRQQFSSLS